MGVSFDRFSVGRSWRNGIAAQSDSNILTSFRYRRLKLGRLRAGTPEPSMNRLIWLELLVIAVVVGHSSPLWAQNSAPSSHLVFDDNFSGDILINEVRVPKSGEATYT
jgi:hypothetical protein